MGSRTPGGRLSGEEAWAIAEDREAIHRLSRTMAAVRPEQAVAEAPAPAEASPQTESEEVERRRLPILERVMKLFGVKVER